MEPEEAVQEEAAAPLPLISAALLLHVRQVQAEHGLKHTDYKRYRHYCAKRLRKLYSGLKILHGRGRYQKRELLPEHYLSERHLHVPLVNAERAWATAMEMKHQDEQLAPKAKHYMTLKLRKAVKWAEELARVANARCDAKTALEAESYAAMMAGTLHVENGTDYRSALKKFQRAEIILQELVAGGTFEQQSVCRGHLKELEPNIRFCRYQMERDGSSQDGPTTPLSPNIKALKKRLATMDTDQEQQSGSGPGKAASTFTWRGSTYQLNSEKVSTQIAAADELLESIKDVMKTDVQPDPRIAMYDKAISLYNDARHLVHTTYITNDSSIAEVRDDAQNLVTALRGRRVELQLSRARCAISDARERLRIQQMRTLSGRAATAPAAQQTPAAPKAAKQRPLKAEDVARLYDGMESLLGELSELASHLSAVESEQLTEECLAQTEAAKAGQMLYVAAACMHRGKYKAAVSAAQQAADKSQAARSMLEDIRRTDSSLLEELVAVEKQAGAMASLSVAEFYSASAATADAMKFGQLNLKGASATSGSGPGTCLEGALDEWKAFTGEGKGGNHIYAQGLTPIPVRPFTLDAALNYVEMPAFDDLYAKTTEKKSTFSRLFGWS